MYSIWAQLSHMMLCSVLQRANLRSVNRAGILFSLHLLSSTELHLQNNWRLNDLFKYMLIRLNDIRDSYSLIIS